MKRQGLLIAGLLAISLLIGCVDKGIQVPTKAEASGSVEQVENYDTAEIIKFDHMENVFGFADESGKRLITISDENGSLLSNPEAFDVAIGNNGEVLAIKFVKRQEANDKDSFRQTMYNFDNMEGYIYEAAEGAFIPNKAYWLTAGTNVGKDAFIKLNSTRVLDSNVDYYQSVDGETINKIETIKGRKITNGSLIAETADKARICLFVFERQGDDMLASIAYISDDKAVFRDYPAKYDEMSTWRVDAGDEPGLFEVLFLANSDQGLLLGLTWAAPEGENILILKEANGVFEETGLSVGRYWAP